MTDTPIDRESVERLAGRLSKPQSTIRPTISDSCDGAKTLLALRAALDEADARLFYERALTDGAHRRAKKAEARAEQAAQEARAVALREAAEWHKEVITHDRGGLDYASAVGIPISNAANLRASVAIHEYALNRILALIDTPAAKALERVRAEEREACAKVAFDLLCDAGEPGTAAIVGDAIRARGET